MSHVLRNRSSSTLRCRTVSTVMATSLAVAAMLGTAPSAYADDEGNHSGHGLPYILPPEMAEVPDLDSLGIDLPDDWDDVPEAPQLTGRMPALSFDDYQFVSDDVEDAVAEVLEKTREKAHRSIDDTRNSVRDKVDNLLSIVFPTQGTFTSGFGSRWGSHHNGIDIANEMNTPIRTVMDGVVIDSGPAQGYGQWIRIKHKDGSISVYGHMETLKAQVGDFVDAGDVIAGMGTRGFSTGVHLHFEIWPDGQTPVDPIEWMKKNDVKIPWENISE